MAAACQKMELGPLVIEGKTKKVYDLVNNPGQVYVVSKDRITAGDGVKAHDLQGKAVISTDTACKLFKFLSEAGVRSHFVRRDTENTFVARKCHMVPIEWVARRIATGSFLKRHQGVPEGYRFAPVKLETFFKDDANHDPQWSEEQLISAQLKIGGRTIGRRDVDIMHKTTATVFEILERAWASLDCTLIDMKVEFGVDVETGELLMADLIDSDSWRLWPSGDKRLMKDKQVYRNLQEVTAADLERVKSNFAWIAEKVTEFSKPTNARVVVIMGGSSDLSHGQKVQKEAQALGIPCELRLNSGHKATDQTFNIAAHYESDGVPTVFVAIAGRSNGLGPVLSGRTTYPVINCPPVTPDWGALDVWSSLRMPSGLGCSTVLSPEAAALHAAQIFGLTDHTVWAKLRARQLNTWIGLIKEDEKLNPDL